MFFSFRNGLYHIYHYIRLCSTNKYVCGPICLFLTHLGLEHSRHDISLGLKIMTSKSTKLLNIHRNDVGA